MEALVKFIRFKENFICRVSSVLNKDYKMYGKENILNEDDTVCWASESVRVIVEYRDHLNGFM